MALSKVKITEGKCCWNGRCVLVFRRSLVALFFDDYLWRALPVLLLKTHIKFRTSLYVQRINLRVKRFPLLYGTRLVLKQLASDCKCVILETFNPIILMHWPFYDKFLIKATAHLIQRSGKRHGGINSEVDRRDDAFILNFLHSTGTELNWTYLNKSTQLHDAFIGHSPPRHYTMYWLAAAKLGQLVLG